MRAKINGTELFFKTFGEDHKPALILNHSLATSHEMWGLQALVFARHFRVIVFDMRGHGASAVPGGVYSLDQLADDVVGIADHLDIKRFSFLGLSIGGMIGQNLGFRHGSRLEKLVLSSTGTGVANPEGAKMWDDRIAAVKAQGMSGQIEGTISRWISADFQKNSPLMSQWICDLIGATPLEGFAGCADAIKTMNLPADKLRMVKAPTFVVGGEKDASAPPSEGAKIAAAIPGAQSFVLHGGYHLCNVEFPHIFNEHILSFLLNKDHA